jgi:hypothetical protein
MILIIAGAVGIAVGEGYRQVRAWRESAGEEGRDG